MAEVTIPPFTGSIICLLQRHGLFEALSFVSGVKLFYHEATFGDDHEELARQTQHSTASHGVIVAREAVPEGF